MTATVGDLIVMKALQYADRQAMVCSVSDQTYTYTDLAHQALHLRTSLQSIGIIKGDVVCLVCHNTPEFTVFCLAAMLCGAIVSTANPSLTTDELVRQLMDSDASLVFCGSANIGKIKSAKLRCPMIKHIAVLGNIADDCIAYSSLLEGWSATARPVHHHNVSVINADVAFLPYSSGTTGLPKGVMLTNHNVMINFKQYGHESVQTADPSVDQEVYVAALPLFHVFGLLTTQLYGLFKGYKIVYMPSFSLKEYLRVIEKYKATMLHLVPPMILMMLNQPDLVSSYILTSVHLAYCGAAPLSREREQAFLHLTGIRALRQGYGMTETSPVLTVAPRQRWKSGSVGILVPDTEARVIDVSSGCTLAAGQTGELWFRGPQIMKGYWKRPDATRETVDADAWLHTGDIGYFDEDGHFYITDRLKELIKYKGHQVAPAELESILLTHPDVEDAAVVGRPHPMSGEVPMAFVVRKANSTLTDRELMKFMEGRVSPHKWLRGGIVFADEIPKSPSGKILRRILTKTLQNSKL